MVQTYVGGIAPRSERYMRTHWDHAKGFIDDTALEAARHEEEARWSAAQQEAGLTLLSPSLVAWEDILRPVTGHDGCEVGALTRTFETNTFHRQPVLTGPVATDALDAAVQAVALGAPWVLTLPSPYDFAVRADIQIPAEGRQDALDSVAACLRHAAGTGIGLGAERVRFHEPSALYPGHDVDTPLLGRLLAIAAAGIEESCILHLTQGDPFARPEVLHANPCTGLGIEADGSAVPDGTNLSGTELSVGVVRGEQSLVEDPEQGRHAAVALAEATGATLWGLTNGWDLEHVPFDVAVRKLAVLAQARPVEVQA